jgi:hypothetical protein
MMYDDPMEFLLAELRTVRRVLAFDLVLTILLLVAVLGLSALVLWGKL